MNLEANRQVAVIRIGPERKAGELLKKMASLTVLDVFGVSGVFPVIPLVSSKAKGIYPTRRYLGILKKSAVVPGASPVMKGKPLSPRELEVLQLLSQGHTQREISKKLRRSFNTIAMHRQHILAKLGVTSTAKAFKVAVARGIITEKK